MAIITKRPTGSGVDLGELGHPTQDEGTQSKPQQPVVAAASPLSAPPPPPPMAPPVVTPTAATTAATSDAVSATVDSPNPAGLDSTIVAYGEAVALANKVSTEFAGILPAEQLIYRMSMAIGTSVMTEEIDELGAESRFAEQVQPEIDKMNNLVRSVGALLSGTSDIVVKQLDALKRKMPGLDGLTPATLSYAEVGQFRDNSGFLEDLGKWAAAVSAKATQIAMGQVSIGPRTRKSLFKDLDQCGLRNYLCSEIHAVAAFAVQMHGEELKRQEMQEASGKRMRSILDSSMKACPNSATFGKWLEGLSRDLHPLVVDAYGSGSVEEQALAVALTAALDDVEDLDSVIRTLRGFFRKIGKKRTPLRELRKLAGEPNGKDGEMADAFNAVLLAEYDYQIQIVDHLITRVERVLKVVLKDMGATSLQAEQAVTVVVRLNHEITCFLERARDEAWANRNVLSSRERTAFIAELRNPESPVRQAVMEVLSGTGVMPPPTVASAPPTLVPEATPAPLPPPPVPMPAPASYAMPGNGGGTSTGADWDGPTPMPAQRPPVAATVTVASDGPTAEGDPLFGDDDDDWEAERRALMTDPGISPAEPAPAAKPAPDGASTDTVLGAEEDSGDWDWHTDPGLRDRDGGQDGVPASEDKPLADDVSPADEPPSFPEPAPVKKRWTMPLLIGGGTLLAGCCGGGLWLVSKFADEGLEESVAPPAAPVVAPVPTAAEIGLSPAARGWERYGQFVDNATLLEDGEEIQDFAADGSDLVVAVACAGGVFPEGVDLRWWPVDTELFDAEGEMSNLAYSGQVDWTIFDEVCEASIAEDGEGDGVYVKGLKKAE